MEDNVIFTDKPATEAGGLRTHTASLVLGILSIVLGLLIALVGVLADKDYGEMFRPVMEYVTEFVCVTPDNPRKLPAAELAEHLQRAGAQAVACATVAEGVAKAKELAGGDGAVLCFGSLYTIGDIKAAV